MLMSKNWMVHAWSWDYLFNAWAYAPVNPEFAWDQFMVILDYQDEFGCLPDAINDCGPVYIYNKPPIQGWILKRMMEEMEINHKMLEQIYDPLCRWTEWWFKYRDTDKDGIPQYHHGNDSGWDNATVFDEGGAVESPDLSAFLILQMNILAEIAEKLGQKTESIKWGKRSDAMLKTFISHCWDGEKFVAKLSGSHKIIDCQSLLPYISMVLGKLLPKEIFEKAVATLKKEGEFLTEWGLATENTKSPEYEPDGYWRGPIWPPEAMIIIDGLRDGKEVEFSKDLARRYCDMCKKSGMAENYDAITGEANRDKAYTWGSSVFLILVDKYL